LIRKPVFFYQLAGKRKEIHKYFMIAYNLRENIKAEKVQTQGALLQKQTLPPCCHESSIPQKAPYDPAPILKQAEVWEFLDLRI
jgi:hypothetical protein